MYISSLIHDVRNQIGGTYLSIKGQNRTSTSTGARVTESKPGHRLTRTPILQHHEKRDQNTLMNQLAAPEETRTTFSSPDASKTSPPLVKGPFGGAQAKSSSLQLTPTNQFPFSPGFSLFCGVFRIGQRIRMRGPRRSPSGAWDDTTICMCFWYPASARWRGIGDRPGTSPASPSPNIAQQRGDGKGKRMQPFPPPHITKTKETKEIGKEEQYIYIKKKGTPISR